MLIPRRQTPPMALETLDHGRFDLDRETSRNGTLICVYRGLHCPICINYLKTLEEHVPLFANREIGVIALTCDGMDRAKAMAEKVGARQLRICHSWPLAQARKWGLYISTSRGKTSVGVEEPDLFPEPGLFLVKPGRELYLAMVQNMPHARPHIDDILKAIDRIIEVGYPARGEYSGPLPK